MTRSSRRPTGSVALEDTFISDESSDLLYDALDLQRAAQAYIWSHPLVSMTTWRDEQAKAYGVAGRGGFIVLKSFNEKLGVVTANLTTPYIFNFDNIEGDPLFIDYPAGATAGGVLDMWQRPVADLGLTGPDGGNGGTYIVVGPGGDPSRYQGMADFVIQSPTNNIFFGLRFLDQEPAFAARFWESIKVAPVGGEPVELVVSEGADIPWSATAPRGVAYFEKLHTILNEEPVREQDKVWIAMLEPLGIELGSPFAPTERQARLLAEGAALGELMQRNIQINPRFAEPYWEGTHWYKSFDFGVDQITDTEGRARRAGLVVLRGRHEHRRDGQPQCRQGAGLHDQQTGLERRSPPRRSNLSASGAGRCPRRSVLVVDALQREHAACLRERLRHDRERQSGQHERPCHQ